ncbi:hypothetical protein LVJ83_11035 [Uruburuella testudinis]|uniref:Uncharacterized protein n=1 Tax=Uruburuella testudinis TaxID=1282863 RepID=A0ABY4DS85_9NEIS|nr:hypothetical protein [Uruburuella testudinis]UOO81472.1 hypothetical protein LVJ83_11035 [Uruburuella testudinis]
MQKNNHINKLIEQLQWLTSDDYSLDSFLYVSEKQSFEENRYNLQICLEFIYRCFKCDLITWSFIADKNLAEIHQLDIPEKLVKKMGEYPLTFKLGSGVKFPELQSFIWDLCYVTSTEKLDEIVDKCALERGEYLNLSLDLSDNRWVLFKNEIYQIFLANNLPLNMKCPLFPIK